MINNSNWGWIPQKIESHSKQPTWKWKMLPMSNGRELDPVASSDANCPQQVRHALTETRISHFLKLSQYSTARAWLTRHLKE
jgi:ABC-type Mn2+/Zn2+ transport system ATPase subunit